ncbi:hypothetical protein ACGFZA_42200 [Streptomyces sp. NPDC048211]|uniref:hypothetical protein n=1 Tax=Streptomyces sp. NPDC048211 TaxID=3365516 RepID=UPI003721039E
MDPGPRRRTTEIRPETPPAPAEPSADGRSSATTQEQVRHARHLLARPENTVTSIAKLLGVYRNTKRETLQGAQDYGDADTCRRTVFDWLTRYNTRRRHSANGHLSPNRIRTPTPNR